MNAVAVYVREHPGKSTAQIAEAMGLSVNEAYAPLRAAQEAGRVRTYSKEGKVVTWISVEGAEA